MSSSRLTAALAATVLVCGSSAAFADPPAPAIKPGPTATSPAADPVVASVNDQTIHLSDVRAAATQLPEEMRNLPPQMLFPMVVNQLIDQRALVDQAKSNGLQDDPKVQQMMKAASDTALQNALLSRDITPLITDDKLRAAYQAQYAKKTGQEEVHARHILLPTEAQADDVIKQLHGGADFSTLAKKLSKDPAAQSGGDLGWFKKGDMLPEFSNQAFSMKKGEISSKPVHTRYGWHVIQVLDTRVAPPPSFDSVKDQIRQGLIQASVRQAVKQAMSKVKVVQYNPDGSVQKPAPPVKPPGGASALPAPASPAPGQSPPNSE